MVIYRKKVKKSVAVFLLITFVANTFAPSVAMALTTGAHQPEFSDYEEPGATDMVNLLTGDFSYNIPALDVPGPEGGFSLPLSYHAGIGPETEASWVGLGFSMNAGAINRNVVGYPDDANGEHFDIHKIDPDVQRGWNASLGPFGNLGWNSNSGHHGTISLLSIVSASYNNGSVNDIGLVGVHASKGDISVNPAETMNAAMTIASFGASKGFSSYQAFAKAASSQLIRDGVTAAAAAAYSAFGNNGSKSIATLGYFPLSYHKKGFNYWYSINATRSEWMYGSLNLGNMQEQADVTVDTRDGYQNPRVKNSNGTYEPAKLYSNPINQNIGPSSDMHMRWDGTSYYNQDFLGATSIAKDNFSVQGIGISGSISPYRHDLGTLSFPRDMTENHQRIALVKFKSDYKVPFKYEGGYSNTYTHHAGKEEETSQPDVNQPLFGVSHTLESNGSSNKLLLDFSDKTLTEQRTEPNRAGLQDNKLATGRNIDWFTNEEIINDTEDVLATGFIDFLPSSTRASFRQNLPPKGIGGFSITREDGLTYHYALPVYDKNHYTKIIDTKDNSKFSELTRSSPFAHTWLLTAITGADYLDTNNGSRGIVDESDYGYWVKFEYGKFSESYLYRMPYGPNDYLVSEDKVSKQFSQGERENYYLNAIKTRSHTALFIKGLREDARGTYSYNGFMLGRAPASSLKLEEVVVLTNEDVRWLVEEKGLTYGTSVEQVKAMISAGSGDPYSGDSWDGVLDQYDIDNTNKGGSVNLTHDLHQRALKRIKFNYSYALCSKTPNSFKYAKTPPLPGESSQLNGKLTLESLSLYGRSDTKLSPDYIFEYGKNPPYNKDNWDGWGFYQPTGATNNHYPSQDASIGSEWSLVKIITPLGSEINVEYERDTYSTVSGNTLKNKIVATALNVGTRRVTFDVSDTGIDLRDYLSEGQTISFYSDARQRCTCWDIGGSWDCEYDYDIPESQTITNITHNSFVLSNVPGFVNEYDDVTNGRASCGLQSLNGYIIVEPDQLKGGNLRVKSLSVTDENFNVYKTRYLYTESGEPHGKSSGVVAQEPDYVRKYSVEFGQEYDYPFTPVLYAKTTVLNGKLSSDEDYITKQIFEFQTPSSDDVREVSNVLFNDEVNYNYFFYGYNQEYLKEIEYEVEVNTGAIGQPKAISVYDKNDVLLTKSFFQYSSSSNDSNQGIYTEGSILAEKLRYVHSGDPDKGYINFLRIFRTTKKYRPSILTGVVTVSGGTLTQTENRNWDFITGYVTETEVTDSYGNKYRNITKPAYHKYPDMGSKALHPQNKNMLAQSTGNYLYKVGANALLPLQTGVVTWKKHWDGNRVYNGISGMYENTQSVPSWRLHQSYTWLSSRVNADGSLMNFADFDWSTESQNQAWVKQTEQTRYDNFSMPLESVDLNGNYAMTKMGYDERLKIVSGVGAKYTEIAYSGAEDKFQIGSSAYHFGGEVQDADKQDATFAHTGEYSIKLLGGQKGFTYKVTIGNKNETNSEVESNKRYRISAWVHKTDVSGNGKIYAEVNGTTLPLISIQEGTKQFGDWILLNATFDLPPIYNGQVLTVGVVNEGSSIVYFDDFRFQPLSSEAVCYVYDPNTFQLTYILDNNNIYTRFEYDHSGRLIKSYREISSPVKGEFLVSESKYNFARMQSALWQATGNLRCVVGTDGGNTGQQEKEQQDVNHLSSTFNQIRWVLNSENSPDCPPCIGENKRVINGVCEAGVRENISTSHTTNGQYVCYYQFRFSDGSTSQTYTEVNSSPCSI